MTHLNERARRAVIGRRMAEPYVQYHPSLREEALSAIGCAAHMAGIVIGALVIWALLAALILGGAS